MLYLHSLVTLSKLNVRPSVPLNTATSPVSKRNSSVCLSLSSEGSPSEPLSSAKLSILAFSFSKIRVDRTGIPISALSVCCPITVEAVP